MANGQGGRRTPGQPAPVSGPGRLSKRTDGGPQQTQAEMTGMPYGENAEFNTLQGQAPMSAAGQTTARAPRPRQGRSGGGMGGPVPLFSPTQRPDEPITAGAPFGPGDGPRPMSQVSRPSRSISSSLLKAAQFDNDPIIARVADVLARRGL
jgi:hypothetical protein